MIVFESVSNKVVSGYFACLKKRVGQFCPIASLKYTNTYIVYNKFCMGTAKEIK